MKTSLRTFANVAFMVFGFNLVVLEAQQGSNVPRDLLDVLPSALDHHALALGDRVRKPGKERTVLVGTLLQGTEEPVPVRVVVQLPALVRLEGFHPNGRPAVFDGKNRAVADSRIAEQVLEIFSSDTAEGMLAAIKDGAAVELLGRRVAVRSGGTEEDRIQRFDIFEVSGEVPSVGRQRVKRYSFDSQTGLLAATEYSDDGYSPPVNVEIVFSNWMIEAGSSYPRRIERRENGRPALSLTIRSIVALPRQDPASISQLVQTGSQEE